MSNPDLRYTPTLPAPEYAPLGASTIAYRTFGTGDPLVFITGWPFHSATYTRVARLLSDRFRCVLLDSPGLGLTHWSDDTDFSFPGQARNFSAFLDALGIDDYFMIAHDTGATIARLMAAEHGRRLRGFVILNTEIPNERPPWFPLYARLMRLPGAAALFRLPLGSRLFLRSPMGFRGCYSDASWIDARFVSTYIQPLLDDPRRLEGAMRYLSIGLDFALIDALPRTHACIRAPVHFIWGADDPTFPLKGAQRMQRQFPDCSGITEIAGGKLLAHEEFPEQVAAAAHRVLESM